MLRIDHVSKRFGDQRVFDGLTASFAPGCFALCEEENTGKSTLLNIAAGVLAPDEGEVWVDGYGMSQASQHARARLAFVPANVLSDPTQTGRGLLHAIAAEKRTLREDRVSEGLALDEAVLDLADRLGLTPHLDKRFEQMSTGTRRKVYLAAAGLGTPSVLIADGPTDGLDAQARRVVADLFLDWGRDRVVLFASHDEALVRACAARPITIASLR